jgi:hypothetical protein
MNMKRMRGRNHRPNGGGGGGGGGFRNQQNGIPLNRNHVFDSTGPEMRVRGTAQQLYEKYQQLARDASSSGDRVTGEAYYQHAEHYFRIINAINQAQGQPGGQQGQPSGQSSGQPYQNNGQDRGNYQNNGQGDYNRRQDQNTDVSTEPQPEHRAEQPRAEQRSQEPRFQEPRQERRFEQRPYEPRNKPEFNRQDRPDRTERFRPEQPVADPRIDISSALEAELAAAVAEPPDLPAPAGFGDQPAIPEPRAETRAIPIIPDAPPPAPQAARLPRPRGRPRAAKPDAEEKPDEAAE